MSRRTEDELAVAVRHCLEDGMTAVQVLDLVGRAIFHPGEQPAPELRQVLAGSREQDDPGAMRALAGGFLADEEDGK